MERYRYLSEEKVDKETGCTYTYIDGQNWTPNLHDHDYYEIFLVLDNSVVHYVNGVYQELCRGTLVFIRPKDLHTFAFRKDIPNSVFNITFTKETVHTLFDYLTDAFPSKEMLDSDMPPSIVLSESETVMMVKKTSGFLDPKISSGCKAIYILMLLAELLTNFFTDYKSNRKESLPKWLDTLCIRMQKQENFIAGLSRMIELSGRDHAYLGRSVKRFLGTTPTAYVNSLRVSYAANLLLKTNEEITDICYASGFNCYTAFYSCFCNKYGMSPTRFRNTFQD